MEEVKLNAGAAGDASVVRGGGNDEHGMVLGKYIVECRDADGNLKWTDEAPNIVTSQGRALLLDNINTANTGAVTAYIGMISSVGWSAAAAADTMGSHAGWTEAGDTTNLPVWTTPAAAARVQAAWSAATGTSPVSKSLSSAAAFTMSSTPTQGAGTLKGCFMVCGSGAVSTHDSTAGVLMSAGTFTGGDKVVGINDVVNVSYTISLT